MAIYGYEFQHGVHESLKRLSKEHKDKHFTTKEVMECYLLFLNRTPESLGTKTYQNTFKNRIRQHLNSLAHFKMATRTSSITIRKNYVLKFRAL